MDRIKMAIKRKEKLCWSIEEKNSLLKSITGGNLPADLKDCAKSIQDEISKLPECQKEMLTMIQVFTNVVMSSNLIV